MSLILGLFAACGWLIMTGKPPNEQHAVTIFLTVWAFSALAFYCVLPYNKED